MCDMVSENQIRGRLKGCRTQHLGVKATRSPVLIIRWIPRYKGCRGREHRRVVNYLIIFQTSDATFEVQNENRFRTLFSHQMRI